MSLISVITLFILAIISIVTCSNQHFATKNTYSSSKDYLKKHRSDVVEKSISGMEKEVQLGHCEAVHLNSLLRHGIRNPGRRDLVKLDHFFAKVREFVNENGRSTSEVAQKVYKAMETWFEGDVFANAKHTDKELTPTGYQEMYEIGQFVSQNYPSLVNDGQLLKFISSKTHRTVNSCKAFQDGLQLSDTDLECYIDNHIMRFFDQCPHYRQTMENLTNLREAELFKVGPEVDGVIHKLQANLAVHNEHRARPLDIEYGDLKALYTVSACEVAIHKTSTMREIFDDSDLRVMEFAADMRSYWKRSYGHVINYRQACDLFTHLVTTMEEAVKGSEGHATAVLRFGHAETLLPVLSLLGLYKDPAPLTSLRYHKLFSRQFKTGQIMSFSANIMFVLYRCESEESEESEEGGEDEIGAGFKIVLLHNEVPVHLPPCPDQYMCSFNAFKQYYQHITTDCNFNEICNVKSHDEL